MIPEQDRERAAGDVASGAEPSDSTVRRILGRVGHIAGLPLIWLIRFYQLVISPLTPPTCRYYPSCSEYALTAVAVHGPIRGIGLAIRRLLRCHPFHPGGVDHVPPRRDRTTAVPHSPVATHQEH